MKRLICVVLTGMLILGTASVAYADTSNEEISTAETSNVETSSVDTSNEETNNEDICNSEISNEKTSNEEISNIEISTPDTSNAETAINVIYKDLKNTNWAYEAVNTMSQKGIVKGYTDGNFRPRNVVTYGEFIKMALVSATKEDVGNAPTVNPITGAKQNWAKNYYDKALGIKYFGSTDIKENQLSYPISRSDMALIISNILGETKIDNYDELESDLKDVNSETKNDYDIIKTYATGIITGYEDRTFKPEKTLTRAESATVIYRFVDESKRVMPVEKKEETEVKTNVDEVIQNRDTFLDDAKNVDSYLSNVTCYRIVEDAAPYDFELTKRFDVTGFNSIRMGNLYFMKDNKIVEQLPNLPNSDGTAGHTYDTDISKIDYIVSVPNTEDEAKEGETVEMLLIVNPFKK